MLELLRDIQEKNKNGDLNKVYNDQIIEHEVHWIQPSLSMCKMLLATHNKEKQKVNIEIGSYFVLRTILGSQPTLKSILSNKIAIYKAKRVIKAKNGCTIMIGGWTNQRQRILISLVYCLTIIDWVGVKNVIHLVTDNATNYVATSRLIQEKYETIFWSPYFAHCLNILLMDIASIMLHTLPQRLQSHKLAKTVIAKYVSVIILDNKFWNDCFVIGKNSIKDRDNLYRPYINIFKARWDKQLKHNLHAMIIF
ncbi:hypothetical protein CR513_00325, partial [Mucuna pruriens]